MVGLRPRSHFLKVRTASVDGRPPQRREKRAVKRGDFLPPLRGRWHEKTFLICFAFGVRTPVEALAPAMSPPLPGPRPGPSYLHRDALLSVAHFGRIGRAGASLDYIHSDFSCGLASVEVPRNTRA